MAYREEIRNLITAALQQVGLPEVEFSVEHPSDMTHGDYASNVAMALAKQVGKSPREVAEDIAAALRAAVDPRIASIDIAGPGFLNITLSNPAVHQFLSRAQDAQSGFGNSTIYSGKKILVEHSSPNLFKPFHIGHMMNNAIGESLARLMRVSGATVRTMSFPSDISLGIAKAIFILLETQGTDYIPTDISILGDAYVTGTKRYEEDESIHARVKEIADNLYANIPSPELDLFLRCKEFNIAYFEHVVEKLGSHFDSYIYESEAGEKGKELVLEHTPAIFTESEGAIVYIPAEENKGISTSVFVNSQGNPTYEAKDLGLLSMKFNLEHPDLSIFVTDYQQIPHFNAVLDAAAKINPEWSSKSHHTPHGRMSFKGQKMSSRLGGVPLATDMIEVVAEEARVRAKDAEQEDMSESIAIAAIKFSILRTKPGQNINFDPETSLSFEGDSGPYLQYTHARIQTLLDKGREAGFAPELSLDHDLSEVERIIVRFPDIVENAIVEYAPQHIVTYLLELARAFNSFYGEHKVIDTENPAVSKHRLAIARATGETVRRGLDLLGIVAPDRM